MLFKLTNCCQQEENQEHLVLNIKPITDAEWGDKLMGS